MSSFKDILDGVQRRINEQNAFLVRAREIANKTLASRGLPLLTPGASEAEIMKRMEEYRVETDRQFWMIMPPHTDSLILNQPAKNDRGDSAREFLLGEDVRVLAAMPHNAVVLILMDAMGAEELMEVGRIPQPHPDASERSKVIIGAWHRKMGALADKI